MMPEILVDNLSHTFGKGSESALTVLEGIDLKFESGSFNTIIGTSGCGKSTLLKMMAGLFDPSDGEMTLDGSVIQGTDRRRGMVFQQDAVFPWMTVAKNISYGPRLRGASRADQREIEAKWTEAVGLKGFEDRWPRELSGGMRKRVDIGRVYANDPDVLLMDEPFGALDAQTKERMQSDLLKTWSETKKTVVFVTHDIEEAIFLSDKIVVLSARPGRVHHIEEVQLPRPRTDDMRLTDEFLEIKRRLWAMLDH
ncbi:ABC transporter ATP-binding protein [Cognatishimia sp. WU-CL00825]